MRKSATIALKPVVLTSPISSVSRIEMAAASFLNAVCLYFLIYFLAPSRPVFHSSNATKVVGSTSSECNGTSISIRLPVKSAKCNRILEKNCEAVFLRGVLEVKSVRCHRSPTAGRSPIGHIGSNSNLCICLWLPPLESARRESPGGHKNGRRALMCVAIPSLCLCAHHQHENVCISECAPLIRQRVNSISPVRRSVNSLRTSTKSAVCTAAFTDSYFRSYARRRRTRGMQTEWCL